MQPEERVRQEPRPELMVPDFLERVIFVGVGSAIWITGFMLMLSILLVFIGLPLFLHRVGDDGVRVEGLAVMQAQER